MAYHIDIIQKYSQSGPSTVLHSLESRITSADSARNNSDGKSRASSKMPAIRYTREDIQEKYNSTKAASKYEKSKTFKEDSIKAVSSSISSGNSEHKRSLHDKSLMKTSIKRQDNASKDFAHTENARHSSSRSLFSNCFATESISIDECFNENNGHKSTRNSKSFTSRKQKFLAHLGFKQRKRLPKNSSSSHALSSTQASTARSSAASRSQTCLDLRKLAGGELKDFDDFTNECDANEQRYPGTSASCLARKHVSFGNKTQLLHNASYITNEQAAHHAVREPSNNSDWHDVSNNQQTTILDCSNAQQNNPPLPIQQLYANAPPLRSTPLQQKCSNQPVANTDYSPSIYLIDNKNLHQHQHTSLRSNNKIPTPNNVTASMPQQPVLAVYKKLPPLPMKSQATQTDITAYHLSSLRSASASAANTNISSETTTTTITSPTTTTTNLNSSSALMVHRKKTDDKEASERSQLLSSNCSQEKEKLALVGETNNTTTIDDTLEDSHLPSQQQFFESLVSGDESDGHSIKSLEAHDVQLEKFKETNNAKLKRHKKYQRRVVENRGVSTTGEDLPKQVSLPDKFSAESRSKVFETSNFENFKMGLFNEKKVEDCQEKQTGSHSCSSLEIPKELDSNESTNYRENIVEKNNILKQNTQQPRIKMGVTCTKTICPASTSQQRLQIYLKESQVQNKSLEPDKDSKPENQAQPSGKQQNEGLTQSEDKSSTNENDESSEHEANDCQAASPPPSLSEASSQTAAISELQWLSGIDVEALRRSRTSTSTLSVRHHSYCDSSLEMVVAEQIELNDSEGDGGRGVGSECDVTNNDFIPLKHSNQDFIDNEETAQNSEQIDYENALIERRIICTSDSEDVSEAPTLLSSVSELSQGETLSTPSYVDSFRKHYNSVFGFASQLANQLMTDSKEFVTALHQQRHQQKPEKEANSDRVKPKPLEKPAHLKGIFKLKSSTEEDHVVVSDCNKQMEKVFNKLKEFPETRSKGSYNDLIAGHNNEENASAAAVTITATTIAAAAIKHSASSKQQQQSFLFKTCNAEDDVVKSKLSSSKFEASQSENAASIYCNSVEQASQYVEACAEGGNERDLIDLRKQPHRADSQSGNPQTPTTTASSTEELSCAETVIATTIRQRRRSSLGSCEAITSPLSDATHGDADVEFEGKNQEGFLVELDVDVGTIARDSSPGNVSFADELDSLNAKNVDQTLVTSSGSASCTESFSKLVADGNGQNSLSSGAALCELSEGTKSFEQHISSLKAETSTGVDTTKVHNETNETIELESNLQYVTNRGHAVGVSNLVTTVGVQRSSNADISILETVASMRLATFETTIPSSSNFVKSCLQHDDTLDSIEEQLDEIRYPNFESNLPAQNQSASASFLIKRDISANSSHPTVKKPGVEPIDEESDEGEESSISVSQKGVVVVSISKNPDLSKGHSNIKNEDENVLEDGDEDDDDTKASLTPTMQSLTELVAEKEVKDLQSNVGNKFPQKQLSKELETPKLILQSEPQNCNVEEDKVECSDKVKRQVSSFDSNVDPVLEHLSRSHPQTSVETDEEPSQKEKQSSKSSSHVSSSLSPSKRRNPLLKKSPHSLASSYDSSQVLKINETTPGSQQDDSMCSLCMRETNDSIKSNSFEATTSLPCELINHSDVTRDKQKKAESDSVQSCNPVIGNATHKIAATKQSQNDLSIDEGSVFTQNYWLSRWLYVSEYEEAEIWRRAINLTHPSKENIDKSNNPDSDDNFDTKSTESELAFSKLFKFATRKMIHRRATIEMYKRIMDNSLEAEKRVEISKNNGEFGFRIHGSKPVVVSAIENGTSAEMCGLQVGDVLYAINGTKILDASHNDVVRLAHGADSSSLVLDLIPTNNFLRSNQYSDGSRCAKVMAGFLTRLSPSTAQPILLGFQNMPTHDPATASANLKTTMRKAWRKRFFLLRADSCLYWYRTSSDIEPLGGLNLQGFSATISTEFSEPRNVIRLLKHGSPPNYLGTQSKAEMLSWIEALNKLAIEANQNDDYVKSTLSIARNPPNTVVSPECYGYLYKFTKKKSGLAYWKAAYFVLKNACLYLFKDFDASDNKSSGCNIVSGENALKASAVYFLHGYKVRSKYIENKPHTFELIPPNRKLIKPIFLMASSEVEKKRWIASMEYSIDRWIEIDE